MVDTTHGRARMGTSAISTFGLSTELTVDYQVHVVDDAIERLRVALGSRRAIVVTTPLVASLYDGLLSTGLAPLGEAVITVVVDVEESNKDIDAVLEICHHAMAHDLGREDVLVAFGGGVCCDIVSVAASLIRRGVPYICVPTTLVGQVDAGIGIKGGVNFDERKSYLGVFTPPEQVFVETTFLQTLPERDLVCGMAEIMKMALIVDAELFELLQRCGRDLISSGFARPAEVGRDVVARSIGLMLEQLQPNCYEDKTFERLVDFGHSFSPVLESRSRFAIAHGEAVAIDMAVSAALAVVLDRLDRAVFNTVLDVFVGLGLPTWSTLISTDVLAAGIDAASAHRGGNVNLVVPIAIGRGAFLKDSAPIMSSLDQALALLEDAGRAALARRAAA